MISPGRVVDGVALVGAATTLGLVVAALAVLAARRTEALLRAELNLAIAERDSARRIAEAQRDRWDRGHAQPWEPEWRTCARCLRDDVELDEAGYQHLCVLCAAELGTQEATE